MRFDLQARTTSAARFWSAAFYVQISAKKLKIRFCENLDMRFDCVGSRKVCVCVLGLIWAVAFFL